MRLDSIRLASPAYGSIGPPDNVEPGGFRPWFRHASQHPFHRRVDGAGTALCPEPVRNCDPMASAATSGSRGNRAPRGARVDDSAREYLIDGLRLSATDER